MYLLAAGRADTAVNRHALLRLDSRQNSYFTIRHRHHLTIRQILYHMDSEIEIAYSKSLQTDNEMCEIGTHLIRQRVCKINTFSESQRFLFKSSGKGLISTSKKPLLSTKTREVFSCIWGEKRAKYGEIGLRSGRSAALKPNFLRSGAGNTGKFWCTFRSSLRLQRTPKRVREAGFEPQKRLRRAKSRFQVTIKLREKLDFSTRLC